MFHCLLGWTFGMLIFGCGASLLLKKNNNKKSNIDAQFPPRLCVVVLKTVFV